MGETDPTTLSGLEVEETEKNKRPADTAFKQQRLEAWQPILKAGTVLPIFIIFGVLFIPIGVFLLFLSQSTDEISIPYTNCLQGTSSRVKSTTKMTTKTTTETTTETTTTNFSFGSKEKIFSFPSIPIRQPTIKPSPDENSTLCADVINQNDSHVVCTCADIYFSLKRDMKGKVFMYYALTNFYQNHRRYVRSRDDRNLIGNFDDEKGPNADCSPFRTDKNKNESWIFPCGAIANSMFSDEISLFYKPDSNSNSAVQVPLVRKGIAWDSDKKYRFKNPKWFSKSPNASDSPWKKWTKPPAWRKELYELDTDPKNNGVENEDFINWMRPATKPNFRKLYRIVNEKWSKSVKQELAGGLPKGKYFLRINYSYPVKPFGGTKSIVFATTSLLGGRNHFLGVAYMMIGAVSLVLAILFFFVHVYYNHSKSNFVIPSTSKKEEGGGGADGGGADPNQLGEEGFKVILPTRRSSPKSHGMHHRPPVSQAAS